MMMELSTLSERKWIDGVLVYDGLERVHIDAIAGVICEGYHSIEAACIAL